MIIPALNNYYHRLQERGKIAPRGYVEGKVSYEIILSSQGEIVKIRDIRSPDGKKKPLPIKINVPLPPKRTSGVKPCFLWDKSSYVLGVTAKTEPKALKRLPEEHKAFKAEILKWIGKSDDEGLRALSLFLQKWKPEHFQDEDKYKKDIGFNDEIKDSNIVFRLDSETRFLHDRPASKVLVEKKLSSTNSKVGMCLASGGKNKKIARLHPSIKGVKDAQSSGASIVSFNKESFESYKKKQGGNAPISEEVVFAYTSALNYLLGQNDNKVQIGDTTVVFWAEATEKAEKLVGGFLGKKSDEQESSIINEFMKNMAEGRPLSELELDLDPETKIFVLGLAPNASRISIRFWETRSFECFYNKGRKHFEDLKINPPPLPWQRPPSVWQWLYAIGPYRDGKAEKNRSVPPQLAGELLRSIISGGAYPYSILSNIIMRIRNDGHINGHLVWLRVAICKAIISRNFKKEVPVSINRECDNTAYVLGRLFAKIENAQKEALGKEVKATVKDRYFGAASATPATVFPLLMRNYQNHFAKLRKHKDKKKRGIAIGIEKEIKEIFNLIKVEDKVAFPKNLKIEEQGMFIIGYYHQSNYYPKKKEEDKS